MAFEKLKGGFDLTKGVFLAYFILILHVLLIVALGLVVLFFRGFISYMIWIFLGGTAILLLSAYYFYRRMKTEGKNLEDLLNSQAFKGRAVEVSLLGGLASLKVGQPEGVPALEAQVIEPVHQLEDPDSIRTRELTELARLFEKELITLDEYNIAKQRLLKSA